VELDMSPGFADDGFLAGDAQEVLRALTHWRQVMPMLGLRFSRLELVLAAGPQHAVDVAAFERLGCTVNLSQTFETVKSPVAVGSQASVFTEGYAMKRAERAAAIVQDIAGLPDKHVALHLLKLCGTFCRMGYLCRTTPRDTVSQALAHYDDQVARALERLIGNKLQKDQHEQARLPVRLGGLGLQGSYATADAAYVASFTATSELGTLVRPEHTWEAIREEERYWTALQRLRITAGTRARGGELAAKVPRAVQRLLEGERMEATPGKLQQRLAKMLGEVAREEMMQRAELQQARTTVDRLVAYGAPGAGKWLNATPSNTLDMNFTNAELSMVLRMQLGVDVYDEEVQCNFCGAVCDKKGVHARSCTCGGDQDVRHNACRDAVHAFAKRGRLRPEREKVNLLAEGLLHEPDTEDGRRPADVLVCAELGPPTEAERAGGRPVSRHALDFAVVNPLSFTRSSEQRGARPVPLTAAGAYAKRKEDAVGARCRQAGVAFVPVVLEVTGGIEQTAALPALHRIAAAVAVTEGEDESVVKAQLLQRLSFEVARSAARAVLRRRPQAGKEAGATERFLKTEAMLEPE